MGRLPLQNPTTATGNVKAIFDGLQKALGVVPNMTRAMATSPSVLQGYAQFSGALAGGSLAPGLREQIAILTAEENSCSYCLSAHSVIGAKVGLSQNRISGARHGEGGDARSTAGLKFARAVLTSKGGVSDADFQAVRAAGFSDAEVAEIIAHVALNVLTNYFNRAAAVEIDFPVVRAKGDNHG
ncbi:MAG: carboxymuconolactone decarboxylase family protein [Planctomycetota bacterium]|nr:carboxymuconolactone decarboxylase family protein [Planctomycetota bacterium]